MIRLKTISHTDPSQTDREEFLRFRALVRERYPALFEKGEGWGIDDFGILIRIPGKSSDRPSVLMAHYDVVDADASQWSFEPFGGEYRDGKILGRGTLDTKSTLCAILEAAEALCEDGFVPQQDLYLSFGGEEEVCGETCSKIVHFLKERGVRPAFVLDEGGAVIPEGVPGVKKQAAMIGIAEKGVANYAVSLELASGGHASVPPKHTAVGRLARAAVAIEEHPFPARISSAVACMFRYLAPEVPLPMRTAFLHPERLGAAISAGGTVLGGSFNAMVRSTAAVTVMSSQSSLNVLPTSAALGVNVRLLEGDTVESARKYLEKVIHDPQIRVDLITGSDPSPVSEIDCPEWENLTSVVRRVWPDTVVAPYQLNGGTDARFYAEISNHVYRFSPMIMSKEDRATVHGIDEAIDADVLMKTVYFYLKLIMTL